nr:hypothetical protein [Paenibacillus sp. MSJ-34]
MFAVCTLAIMAILLCNCFFEPEKLAVKGCRDSSETSSSSLIMACPYAPDSPGRMRDKTSASHAIS